MVKSFAATPTGKTGIYHATVRFPAEGSYSYEVYDGFTQYGGAQTHTFKPVAIGPADDGAPVRVARVALGLAAALAAATTRRCAAASPRAGAIRLREAA